jgi:hypothetical protein
MRIWSICGYCSWWLFLVEVRVNTVLMEGAVVVVIVWKLDFTIIWAISAVSSNHIHARCTQQHYVIQFVIGLRQVGLFSPGTPVSPTNKTDHHNITEILLKVALSTINHVKPHRVNVRPSFIMATSRGDTGSIMPVLQNGYTSPICYHYLKFIIYLMHIH